MVDPVLFSSKSFEWETPASIYNDLNAEFHFTLDPCATTENHKCEKYFTKNDDGLAQSWDADRVFMNPPYGRGIDKWIEKASLSKNLVVCLLPARTDTIWFHKYVYGKATIRFLKGRIRFGGSRTGAPFPSMVVIFNE